MILDYDSKGLPIIFDEETADIVYKDTRVSFFKIKSALESGLDEVKITETLTYSKRDGFTTFGCLTLTNQQVTNLNLKVWKLLKQFNKVGNQIKNLN
jgi:hypothetical protein